MRMRARTRRTPSTLRIAGSAIFIRWLPRQRAFAVLIAVRPGLGDPGSPNPGLTAIRTANARCLGNHRMKIAEPAMRNVLGVRRVLALILMLAAVAAAAYLERSVGGDFDLRLVYFLIVLSGAMLLPRSVALAVAAAVAIVSVGVTGVTGTALIINGLTHLVMYGYAALLTSNWEQERRRLMRMSRVDGLTGLRNLRALQEQLPTWLGPAARTGRRMAIMMMDA